MIELADLKRASLSELESIYAQEGLSEVPTGVYRGIHLQWIESTIGTRPLLKGLIFAGFKAVPYGIDFDRRRWFFLHQNLKVGHFQPVRGPSRWRDTDTIGLHYEISRLPTMIRSTLYDEVKPLSDSLCLGFGGINKPTGYGDIFFFALVRVP